MGFYTKNFDRNNHKTIELVQLWWNEKTGEKLGSMALTDYGLMVFNDDHRPIAAMFIYPVMGCSVALLGFPVSNPNVFREERREALKHLATQAEELIKKLNYSYSVSYAGSRGAKELFSRLDYKAVEESTMFCKDLRRS